MPNNSLKPSRIGRAGLTQALGAQRMKSQLTDQAATLITELTALQPPPDSIWLIGSRANGRATVESDTDLIVFGSEAFLYATRSQLEKPQSVDCLVVFNGDDYKDPWQKKNGSLSKLKWQQVDETHAKYIGSKWVPDEESSIDFDADMGNIVDFQEQAIRIWP